jgi:hypothetical protein
MPHLRPETDGCNEQRLHLLATSASSSGRFRAPPGARAPTARASEWSGSALRLDSEKAEPPEATPMPPTGQRSRFSGDHEQSTRVRGGPKSAGEVLDLYRRCRQPPVLTPLPCGRADQSGCDRGCRRPKRKYETGTTPAELTIVTTVAHAHFGPRTWLAGRRFRSTSAASLRMPSATAAMASSLRVRWLRSLHCLLAAMPSPTCTA